MIVVFTISVSLIADDLKLSESYIYDNIDLGNGIVLPPSMNLISLLSKSSSLNNKEFYWFESLPEPRFTIPRASPDAKA